MFVLILRPVAYLHLQGLHAYVAYWTIGYNYYSIIIKAKTINFKANSVVETIGGTPQIKTMIVIACMQWETDLQMSSILLATAVTIAWTAWPQPRCRELTGELMAST